MVVLQAGPVLLIAAVVGVLWRTALWRLRTDKNAAREVVVAATFLWCLVILWATFFPMTIIFYDWHGASNLMPFASIIQIIRETPPVFAFENIVGNVVLFAPLGVLLPALFDRLKRPGAMLWRAAAISFLIEGTQFLTRARSVDIDDVILNTTGAMVGLGVFTLAAAIIKRWPAGKRFLQRLGSGTRKPLLAGAVPFLITMAIAVPMLISTVVSQTLSRGDIEAAAIGGSTDGEIVAQTNVENRTYLLTASNTPTGQSLRLSEFQKVLPRRYTALSVSDSEPGPTYGHSITAFNPSAGEEPIISVWGVNNANAAHLHITGNGLDTTLALEPGPAFVVGVPFPYDPGADVLEEFKFTFVSADGKTIPGFLHR